MKERGQTLLRRPPHRPPRCLSRGRDVLNKDSPSVALAMLRLYVDILGIRCQFLSAASASVLQPFPPTGPHLPRTPCPLPIS